MRDNEGQFEKRLFKGFIAVWIAGAVIGLAVLGVAGWAVVQLVNWVTAQ